jgi:hypothetical protein
MGELDTTRGGFFALPAALFPPISPGQQTRPSTFISYRDYLMRLRWASKWYDLLEHKKENHLINAASSSLDYLCVKFNLYRYCKKVAPLYINEATLLKMSP